AQVAFLVIQNDPGLPGELAAVLRIADRWERRRSLRRLARRIAENTVNVYERPDLDPAIYADPFPANKPREDVWFWLLHEGHYTAERGLDLVMASDDASDSWGMVI